MRTLPILYQDTRIVGVNKPSGLLVHRSPIDRHETVYALQVLRDQLGRRVHPLHRLDKATSGVLLFALDPGTARTMTEAFTGGKIAKSYLAVVRGYTVGEGLIDHPLSEPRDNAGRSGERGTKQAVTAYRRLATVELPFPTDRHATARFSLVRAEPLTGRMHQVRRHLKHIFHPIIGDTTYGDGRRNELFRSRLDCRRLLLHAEELTFTHPSSGLPVTVRAPLDDAFGALMEQLGWSAAVPGSRSGAPGAEARDTGGGTCLSGKECVTIQNKRRIATCSAPDAPEVV